ncbi:MAG TPA: hypothetical protein VH092_27390, partial [Urbifossiella sp.]|nr:hypothetical protein [Urbifossiella sp.]
MSPARIVLGITLASVVALGCGKKPAPVAEAEPDAVADDTAPRPPRPKPKRVEDLDAPFPQPGPGVRADPAAPFPQPGAGPKTDTTPFPQPATKPPASPKWAPDATPFPAAGAGKKPGPAPAWGGDAATIPLKSADVVTFGPAGCPVAVVGQDVYDLKTFQAARKLPEKYDRHSRTALSHDGRYFAVTEKGRNLADTQTFVYATDTATKVLTVPPAAKGAYADVVAFYGSTHLLVGGRHGPVIEVWEIAKGKKVGGLTSPNRQVREGEVAFTPDGSHFASIAGDKLVVTGTKSAKQALLTPPAGGGPLGARGVYAWAKGLSFSPDGSELALFSTNPTPRLLVWNPKGKIAVDAAVPMPRWAGPNGTLEWLPDSSGWLVNGFVFDRATQRVLVGTRVPLGAAATPHLLDQNRLIGVFGPFGARDDLRAVTIPWDRVRASVQAMEAKADAYLAPDRPVALDIQLAGLRGDEAETRALLGKALTARLNRDGLSVAANAATTLRLRLTEKAGDVLPIVERQSPFDFKGRDTGRTATEAKGAAVLELWAGG